MTWSAWQRVDGEGLDFTEITYEKKSHSELGGGIARVTINKPDKYNVMTLDTVEEMFRAFYDANHDTQHHDHFRSHIYPYFYCQCHTYTNVDAGSRKPNGHIHSLHDPILGRALHRLLLQRCEIPLLRRRYLRVF